VIDSGDPVRDQHARERFLQAYEAGHSFDNGTEGLDHVAGRQRQMAVPLPAQATRRALELRQLGRCRRDHQSVGVGENELDAIQACLAFVDAEREYYSRNPQRRAAAAIRAEAWQAP
jgi:hypothetical protein